MPRSRRRRPQPQPSSETSSASTAAQRALALSLVADCNALIRELHEPVLNFVSFFFGYQILNYSGLDTFISQHFSFIVSKLVGYELDALGSKDFERLGVEVERLAL